MAGFSRRLGGSRNYICFSLEDINSSIGKILRELRKSLGKKYNDFSRHDFRGLR